MRIFEVTCLNVAGVGKRIFRTGELVEERRLLVGSADKLVASGHIKLHSDSSIVESDPPTGQLKIAIITAMWGRESVFKVFGKLTNDLISTATDHQIKVFCVGSEGQKSRLLAESFGFEYVEFPNDKLGQKWNAVTMAAKDWNPDYCLMMGSDDVMNAELLNRYVPFMHNGIDYIGTLDWYFYDTVSKKALYWKGYRKAYNRGVTCGAGRMLSKRVLDAMVWQPWENDRNHHILDTAMENKLRDIKHSRASFVMGNLGGMGLDIKSSTNMTPFAAWDNSEFIDTKDVFKHFNKAVICAA